MDAAGTVPPPAVVTAFMMNPTDALPICVRQRPDSVVASELNGAVQSTRQKHMYIGGLLGTVLVVLLIVWLIRRV